MFRKVASLFLFALVLNSAEAADSIRVALHDGLLWAEVDCSTGKGNVVEHFVVDTGAACSCINLATAKHLGLRLGTAIQVGGVGGQAMGYQTKGFSGMVGDMILPENVLALDLSGPSRACSQTIDGLIGADFFRGHIVRIDYGRAVLSRGADLATNGGMRGRLENGVICVPVGVNGGPARWARLDTGCTDALDWCHAPAPSKSPAHTVALSISSRAPLRADVEVCGTEIRGLPVKFRSHAIFPGEAGLLGNGALSRYRVTIDGISMRVSLDRRAD